MQRALEVHIDEMAEQASWPHAVDSTMLVAHSRYAFAGSRDWNEAPKDNALHDLANLPVHRLSRLLARWMKHVVWADQ